MSTTTSVQPLFTAFTLGNLTLKNRTVMAPMTRNMSPNGVPGANVAAYYRRRAENNVGLIITEGTVIQHADSSNQKDVPHFYGEDALNGWANVVSEVHAAGGKIIPQIWHMGARGSVNDYSEAEIEQIVEAFAQAAADAKRLGFDGIELHGAHGYLIDQFFWERTNQRTDRYGGSLAARTRFAEEVIRASRQAVGPDFPIVLRISQWKGSDYAAKLANTPEELTQFLKPLVDAGVDIFHCSTRRFWQPEFEGSDLNLAGWVKQITGKPTITVGSIGLDSDVSSFFTEGKGANTTSVEGLVHKFEKDEFDLVAIGRALLVDPAWVAKIAEGRTNELIPFTPEALKTLY
ncbi:2,4-dienoyl-CoA reductase-like NADH-dependent reductase (Old Yellow Enzyme family) [Paenibacillus cellulosilyticus]|uniref:2,4-dienoyl-CoA reductase-like NADH-dependent reductase (Old Yellow Enzyme family) n=1 Tax=Paenibacillus cellulosilyticus TaxID=375489 RepID=A0A2V2YUS1_9BACL|nr:NADH:flavin oxidoreductase [Paenibacillus cellulosilyticus]PWW04786.1 2,4-dienoyl-CoA reductase-like NADH-dependent reductase (Old Yellow Enzyme family) [Paenibacillus cellulosilyticus]QKS45908.1 NADH:flavin oxidoreductase [Paenibacillus cellulosilyticus]